MANPFDEFDKVPTAPAIDGVNPFDEFDVQPAQTQFAEKTLMDRMGESYDYRKQQIGKIADQAASGDISELEAYARGALKGGQLPFDAAGNVIAQYTPNVIKQPIVKGISNAASYIANTGAGRAAINAVNDFNTQHPVASGRLGSLVDVANIALPFVPVKGTSAIAATSKAAEKIAKPVANVTGKGLEIAGTALKDSGNMRSIAKQVGAEDLAALSKKSYDSLSSAGEIPAEYFSKFLDTSKMSMPQTAQAQAAFGAGEASNFLKSMESFRNNPISFQAAQELDKGLSNSITKAYSSGDKTEAARLIGIKSALSDTIDALPSASAEYKKAKGLFAASSKQSRIDSILENAQYTDNAATSIRTGFRQLAKEIRKNPRGWTPKEIEAVQNAAKFGVVSSALRIGGSRLISGLVGATGGFGAGGIPGAVVGAMGGEALAYPLRAGAEALQAAKAGKITKQIMSREVVQDALKESIKSGALKPKMTARGLIGAGLEKAGQFLQTAPLEEMKRLPPRELSKMLGAMPPRQAMETMKQLKKVK